MREQMLEEVEMLFKPPFLRLQCLSRHWSQLPLSDRLRWDSWVHHNLMSPVWLCSAVLLRLEISFVARGVLPEREPKHLECCVCLEPITENSQWCILIPCMHQICRS